MSYDLFPKVCVVIPTYNSEDSILHCVDSVLAQDYLGKIEVIIVDDGSTDSTSELIKNKYKNNFNLRYLYKSNGGVSSARNFGIKICECDFIAFCDSDDTWHSNKLRTQIYLMLENNIDFLGSVLKKSNKNFFLKQVSLKMMIFKNYFQPSTVIFRKNIVSIVGYFDEDQNYAEEGNYFLRILHKGFSCYLLNLQLTTYGNGKSVFGDSGLSSKIHQMELGEIKNLIFSFRKLDVPFYLFFIAFVFSFIKYLRRIVIVNFRKICL